MSIKAGELSLLHHPYRVLTTAQGHREELKKLSRKPGSALVWTLSHHRLERPHPLVERRPGGLPLIVILPRLSDLDDHPEIIHLVQQCRPQGILPHHSEPSPTLLAQVLRRPPVDLAADVTDYLIWRGLATDRDTLHLVRRIVELSADIRTITGLARAMYVSRRALGRRVTSRGLPVPSHWLQIARLLRLAIRLQNTDATVLSIAYQCGYTDGFAVSNQMQRLIGYRPSQVREYLGWEWILEEWLRTEAESGGLAPAEANVMTRGSRARGGPLRRERPRIGRPRRARKKKAG